MQMEVIKFSPDPVMLTYDKMLHESCFSTDISSWFWIGSELFIGGPSQAFMDDLAIRIGGLVECVDAVDASQDQYNRLHDISYIDEVTLEKTSLGSQRRFSIVKVWELSP